MPLTPVWRAGITVPNGAGGEIASGGSVVAVLAEGSGTSAAQVPTTNYPASTTTYTIYQAVPVATVEPS